MSLTGIDQCELYVHDERGSLDYLTKLGFRPVAAGRDEPGKPDRHSITVGNGPVRLTVTCPRGSGGPVREFLAEHGEGIADVAMRCDDLARTLDQAAAAGLRTITTRHRTPAGTYVAVVEGFGSVRHTLIEGGPVDPPPSTSFAGTLRALDHVAVCLPAGTLRDTVSQYQAAFGLDYFYGEYVEVGAQAMDSIVVRSPSGGVTFTMIEPDTSHEPGQIDHFLNSNNGAGVQHLAFLVDDVVGAVRRARDAGVGFLPTPDTYYRELAKRLPELRELVDDLRDVRVLADRDEWGHLLQIFTRSPYPRSTLFYELIQRNGARGFGSGNIRALYQAVKAERAQLLAGS